MVCELVRHDGNEGLAAALELSILACWRGYPLHVHTEGLRGTGKTTMIRGAAALLGRLTRITGCPYNCDPAHPHCPRHRGLSPEAIAALSTEEVPIPFLEISASAKLGTVVGSIDLARLTAASHAEAALLPGTLARAHRGVVFVDEINRLADVAPELADALLDVMGTKPGRLQIEEAGLNPVSMPCQVTVWAASNPDEEPGPLSDVRRQLADRFDFGVAMRRPTDPEDVRAILRQDLLTRNGSTGVALERGPILDGAQKRPMPALDAELLDRLVAVYCDFQLESLRAVQAWQAGSLLMALRAGRDRVTLEDVRRTAPLVLHHRLESDDLARVLSRLEPNETIGVASDEDHGTSISHSHPKSEGERVAGGVASLEESGGMVVGAQHPGGWRERLFGRRSAASDRFGLPSLAHLADPTGMPPVVPRAPARPIGRLPTDELWMAARDREGR